MANSDPHAVSQKGELESGMALRGRVSEIVLGQEGYAAFSNLCVCANASKGGEGGRCCRSPLPLEPREVWLSLAFLALCF